MGGEITGAPRRAARYLGALPWTRPMFSLLLLACSTPADTSTKGDTATADTADSVDSGPACAVVNSGDDWSWSGECPQMGTPVVITVDGCTMTLDYDPVGGMTMGMPYSATIEGDVVTFANDDSVDDCVGTVETADRITGTCEGGCTYKLKR